MSKSEQVGEQVGRAVVGVPLLVVRGLVKGGYAAAKPMAQEMGKAAKPHATKLWSWLKRKYEEAGAEEAK